MYAANKTPGQWKAHGRYIARESAGGTAQGQVMADGASRESAPVEPAAELERWQREGEPSFTVPDFTVSAFAILTFPSRVHNWKNSGPPPGETPRIKEKSTLDVTPASPRGLRDRRSRRRKECRCIPPNRPILKFRNLPENRLKGPASKPKTQRPSSN